MIRMVSGLLLAVAHSPGLAAQDVCLPGPESNEAKALAIVSVPVAFTMAGAGHRSGIGLEVAMLPRVSDELATPTTCRPGKGPENANPLPAFARIRAGFTHGPWRLDVGWIPPLTLEGVRANLLAIGLGVQARLGSHWLVTPRLHAVLGSLRAPITCPDAALTDPASECFEGTRSNDRVRPSVYGLELVMARAGGSWRPHAGVGYSLLRPRFQVDFVNAEGVLDQRRVEVDLERMALFAGVTYGSGAWRLTGEGYATVGDRLTGRLVLRRAVGSR